MEEQSSKRKKSAKQFNILHVRLFYSQESLSKRMTLTPNTRVKLFRNNIAYYAKTVSYWSDTVAEYIPEAIVKITNF